MSASRRLEGVKLLNLPRYGLNFFIAVTSTLRRVSCSDAVTTIVTLYLIPLSQRPYELKISLNVSSRVSRVVSEPALGHDKA
jgi:hypothetical protein